jgi:hypothetical protein
MPNVGPQTRSQRSIETKRRVFRGKRVYRFLRIYNHERTVEVYSKKYSLSKMAGPMRAIERHQLTLVHDRLKHRGRAPSALLDAGVRRTVALAGLSSLNSKQNATHRSGQRRRRTFLCVMQMSNQTSFAKWNSALTDVTELTQA